MPIATGGAPELPTIGIDGTEQVVRTAHEHGLALVEAMMLGSCPASTPA